MMRQLQRINVIAAVGAFLCAVVSFFFVRFDDLGILSAVNSGLLTIYSIAMIIHGAILPDRDVELGEKKSGLFRTILLLAMLFSGKGSYADTYSDLTPEKVYRRTWSPGTMFACLVVGSFTFIPALALPHDIRYRLCMIGYAFFFLVLFVLSFVYTYQQSKMRGDNSFYKSVSGVLLFLLILGGIGYFAYNKVSKQVGTFEKIKKQTDAWNEFMQRQQKIYDTEVPDDADTGFTDSEKNEILSDLKQKYGEDVLCKTGTEKLLEKDDSNRYYSEMTVITGNRDSEKVYVHIYRKYLSENDEYEKGKVIHYMTFPSETMNRDVVFPPDS